MNQSQKAAVPQKPKLTAQQMMKQYFVSHPLSEDQQKRATELRAACNLLGDTILATIKPCADQTAMIRKLRELSNTGVQAIALEEIL